MVINVYLLSNIFQKSITNGLFCVFFKKDDEKAIRTYFQRDLSHFLLEDFAAALYDYKIYLNIHDNSDGIVDIRNEIVYLGGASHF